MTAKNGRGKARVYGQDLMKGENEKFGQTPSLAGGLTVGTTIHPYDGSDPQTAASAAGTSIFDPVLCELLYRWFCPATGVVFDPFAGGSVRGIVASKLGLSYTGIDLRPEQVAANQLQAKTICSDPLPKWIVGDSRESLTLCPKLKADFLISCPPYGDLEVYSDDVQDLSTLSYVNFRLQYQAIIRTSAGVLKPDRFAAFVVGDFRDKDGFYRGFPWHTIEAFQGAGLYLYNEAILVTAVGSLPIRVGKQFSSSRKLGRTHQSVLIFVKGDPKKATEACGDVDVTDLFSEFEEAGLV
jgi:hypothetical protein